MRTLLAGTALAFALGGAASAMTEEMVTISVDGTETEVTTMQATEACPDVEGVEDMAGTGEEACEIDQATADELGIVVADDMEMDDELETDMDADMDDDPAADDWDDEEDEDDAG